MDSKIARLLKKWCIEGMNVPYFKDPSTGKPSLSTVFPYVSFVMTVASVIALHFRPSLVMATSTTMAFWVLSVIFYKFRGFSKAKIDLDDKSLEVEGDKDDAGSAR